MTNNKILKYGALVESGKIKSIGGDVLKSENVIDVSHFTEELVQEINSTGYAIHNLDGTINKEAEAVYKELTSIELLDVDVDLTIEENTVITNEVISKMNEVNEILMMFVGFHIKHKNKESITQKELDTINAKISSLASIDLINGNNIKTIKNNANKKKMKKLEEKLKGGK